MSKEKNEDHDLLAALKHRLRRKILRSMSDGRKASPCELAKDLDEKLSDVAYHVRVLVRCGALKPEGRRQVRGATQHFYRWSLESDWAQAMLDETEDE